MKVRSGRIESERVLCAQMTAEREKLNTGNMLEAFPCSVVGGVHAVTLRKPLRFFMYVKDAQGWTVRKRVETRATYHKLYNGTCSAEGLTFPKAEQEQVRKLARVNMRGLGWFDAPFEALILSRKQLGKGFRVWRSGTQSRAVSGWRVHTFPLFNRFERLPGAFSPVAAPELLKVRKSNAEAENSAADYLASFPRDVMNRVRGSSPRWRGTRGHGVRKARAARRVRVAGSYRVRRDSPSTWNHGERFKRVRKALGGMSPERYAAAHLEMFRAAQGKARTLAQLHYVFLQRVRYLAAVDLNALRVLLAELRRLRAEQETYAGFVAHINTAAYVLFLAELSECVPERDPLPRPPDLLPLPPSAPLAPPA